MSYAASCVAAKVLGFNPSMHNVTINQGIFYPALQFHPQKWGILALAFKRCCLYLPILVGIEYAHIRERAWR